MAFKGLRNVLMVNWMVTRFFFVFATHRLQPARLLCPGNSPGKNTGVGSIPFSRGSSRLRDQTSLLHCRQIIYHLSYQGIPDNIHDLTNNVKAKVTINLKILCIFFHYLIYSEVKRQILKGFCLDKNLGKTALHACTLSRFSHAVEQFFPVRSPPQAEL